MNKLIRVQIAYATPEQQYVTEIDIAAESTIQSAIKQSGILDHFPDIDLAKQKVGVFSKLRKLTDEIFDGDRIEIYRPLIIDPKVARRAKAKKKPR